MYRVASGAFAFTSNLLPNECGEKRPMLRRCAKEKEKEGRKSVARHRMTLALAAVIRRLITSAHTPQPMKARVTPITPPMTLVIMRRVARSEEHTSELQSLMRISYAVF